MKSTTRVWEQFYSSLTQVWYHSSMSKPMMIFTAVLVAWAAGDQIVIENTGIVVTKKDDALLGKNWNNYLFNLKLILAYGSMSNCKLKISNRIVVFPVFENP